MTIEHNTLTDPELHEPKGVATAPTNSVYHADGAGSGGWFHPNPHGGCYHENITTGTSVTPAAADTYEVLSPATTVTHLHEFESTSPNRLTYTGSETRHLHLVFNMSFDATSTAGTAIFAVRKNGAGHITGSQTKRYFANGAPGVVAIHWDDVATTGDYYEIIWQHVGTARQCDIYSTYFFVMGMPD